MTQLTTPFHLHAAALSADSPVAPDGDLPAEISGQPATYFWKDLIHVGDYVHPTRKFSLSVDRDRLNRWSDTGSQMLAEGLAIPINCDHSDRARDVVGYVKQFKLDEDRLLGLCQFIGEDAALVAARNLVSVGIDPDFTDGQAKKWGEAIVHLALTPVPVVPKQGQFVEASQAESDALTLQSPPPEVPQNDPDEGLQIPCTQEQFDALIEFIEDLEPTTCIASIIQYLQSITDQSEELSAARKQIAHLSARIPPTMNDEAQSAMIEAATARFDTAVQRGGLSPAARDRLVRLLVQAPDGQANLLTLSRQSSPSGDRALALSIADILLDNRPISPGETTSLQSMSRASPGEDASPLEQLRQYMTRVAST